jgi:hypothetical protein
MVLFTRTQQYPWPKLPESPEILSYALIFSRIITLNLCLSMILWQSHLKNYCSTEPFTSGTNMHESHHCMFFEHFLSYLYDELLVGLLFTIKAARSLACMLIMTYSLFGTEHVRTLLGKSVLGLKLLGWFLVHVPQLWTKAEDDSRL